MRLMCDTAGSRLQPVKAYIVSMLFNLISLMSLTREDADNRVASFAFQRFAARCTSASSALKACFLCLFINPMVSGGRARYCHGLATVNCLKCLKSIFLLGNTQLLATATPRASAPLQNRQRARAKNLKTVRRKAFAVMSRKTIDCCSI